jgi:transposase
MFKKIDKRAACEMRSVIRFLHARNMNSADIHRQLCEVYGEYAMSDSTVRRWVRHFNEGRENVRGDPRSG